MRGRDEHLYHPKWKGYLLVLLGGLNLGSAINLYRLGYPSWPVWGFCVWCFGWGFWWLRKGWGEQ